MWIMVSHIHERITLMVLLHHSVRLMLIHGHAWINTQSNTQEDAPAHLSFSLASCILCNTECTLTFFAQLLEHCWRTSHLQVLWRSKYGGLVDEAVIAGLARHLLCSSSWVVPEVKESSIVGPHCPWIWRILVLPVKITVQSIPKKTTSPL